MRRWRNRLLWTLGVALVTLAIWWRPQAPVEPMGPALTLPADPPDLYIRVLEQTRYNEAGNPTMRTEARDLAFYEARERSLVTEPVVFLLEDQQPNWRIESRTATLYNNGDTDFEEDVEVLEMGAASPIRLTTSWLRVEQEGSFVTTPRPVKLVEGRQVATGIGMDADLAAADPEIKLKAEVAIRYEADSH